MPQSSAGPSSASLPPIVLLVEDDADTSEMYQAALELAGLWVAYARDADDALDYALDLRPDVVVMDVGLPLPAQGLALARELREDSRVADTPIVAVTAFDVERINADAGLFSEVFSKPVPIDVLIRHLKWLAAKSAVVRGKGTRVRARVPELPDRSARLIEESRRLPDGEATGSEPGVRNCPRCRQPLRFSERRELEGVVFDYYQPCPSGCGLFCYDQSRRKIVSLIE